ncbi:MAG TPA: hypothetical protein VHN14_31445 [Kofleriaceae bacterium]|jgi:hypothetical protein|nr:hypothetical protein [Kofleriaceae bacterium]
MRIATALLSTLFVWPLVVAACGDNGGNQEDAEPFETLLDCFNEHHTMESLSVHDAIVVCCLDHPIAGVHPSCEDNPADCVAHVTTELGSSVTASDVQTACTDYLSQN